MLDSSDLIYGTYIHVHSPYKTLKDISYMTTCQACLFVAHPDNNVNIQWQFFLFILFYFIIGLLMDSIVSNVML